MPTSAARFPRRWARPWERRWPLASTDLAVSGKNPATEQGIDIEELARLRARKREKIGRWLMPLLIMGAALILWDRICVWNEIPPYILPRPWLVMTTLWDDAAILLPALLVTLKITFLSLLLAVTGGVGLAVLFAQSRWVEMSLFPFAIILQVTPIVAIFPLINIYVDNQTAKLLLCAWIVAFFPILSNTTLGLNSIDRNLLDYFKLNGASRWQTLWHLRLPASMPYFLGGLKIAGGLALIGAVVAEFVAGAAGQESGLASRIIEAGYRLKIPRLFAALLLISLTGILIFITLSAISHLILRRWHESAIERER
ncbi:MAG: ABC transporter ATP-binding protein [Rhizobiales bacterium]|nr:ABC transporter ATP-binding protein [Hyphomicrobiales bacterium]